METPVCVAWDPAVGAERSQPAVLRQPSDAPRASWGSLYFFSVAVIRDFTYIHRNVDMI